MRHSQYGCLALFLLPFALPLMLMDGYLLVGIAQQLGTTLYASTTGTITRSDVEPNEMRNYHFQVAYTYEVEGRTYVGDSYRTSDWGSGDSAMFNELKARFPVGATVPVYYWHGAPGTAVLLRGVQGLDLFVLLFLVPFNFGILGGVVLLVSQWKRAGEGVRAHERDGRTHVRMSDMSPVVAGLVASAIAAFAFGIGLAPAGGMQVSLPLALSAWAVVVGVGVVFAKRRRVKWDAGDYDLIIDPRARSLSLPAMHERKERLDVPWSRIRSISVDKKRNTDSKGKGTSVSFLPTLEFTDDRGTVRRELLASWGTPERAGSFAEWLESQVERGGPGAKSQSVA